MYHGAFQSSLVLEIPFTLKGPHKARFLKLDFCCRMGLSKSFRIHISTLITLQVGYESRISCDLPKIAELVGDKIRARTQTFRCPDL